MSRGTDRFHAEGAERLAAKVREFWRSRGWLPNIWVQVPEADAEGKRAGVCVVRSDMRGGRPQAHSRMPAA